MFAVVCLPDFCLQALLRHEAGLRSRAVALIDPALPKPIIVQLTATARAQGVTEGLTASQAMARCGALAIKTRSLSQEQAATDVLLQTAYAFSPNIEATAPGICTMDLKGLPVGTSRCDVPARAAAGGTNPTAPLERWAESILEALKALQLDARIGFAVTPNLALLAARAANPVLTLQNQCEQRARSDTPYLPTMASEATVESFPIAALDPAPEISSIIGRWGIKTVGELLALGKDAVAERLGPAAIELFNRVSPDSVRPLKLAVPPETFEERTEFEIEIETAAPLLFVLRRFVEQLSRRLEMIYLVVGELHLRLGLSSGASYERAFKIPAPTGNVGTLFRMLETHLETVRTDSPIISLCLGATPARPETHQFGLFETTLRDPNQFAETLARLSALCGADRVGTPVLEATHRPDAFRLKAPEFDRALERRHGRFLENHGFTRPDTDWETEIQTRISRMNANSNQSPPVRDNSRNSRPSSHIRVHPRPSVVTTPTGLQLRRFRPASPASIEFHGQRPVSLCSSTCNAAVVGVRGPFVSSGNWWDAGQWSREEWDVQTANGAIYRIFRSPEGCFVEGVYD